MTSLIRRDAHRLSEQTKVNILLVDDEARNLDVLESVLTAADYRLVRAQTAQEALLALIDQEFAVIVLDIQMPETSGIELAHLIKQRRRTQHIPIIFLTAYFQEDKDILQGYEVGAVDYLTKPIDSKILRSKISVFVDLFRKNHELEILNRTLEGEITQRLEAEQALRQANNELESRVQARTAELTRLLNEVSQARDAAERASAAKDDFLAALSHELRTPLNPVLLLASEAAVNPELPADVRSAFETITKNVSLEARLIDDLLDVTRITRGKLSLDLAFVDPHEALRDAVCAVQEEIRQKRLHLTTTLMEKPPTIRGDAVRLRQVFWNLLKNAVKFTPEQGRLEVITAVNPADGLWSVTITDTGIGLTSGELARVFDAFSQGDHAGEGRSHRFGGLGLGLAISRNLVELHFGRIEAASPGRDHGATFTVRLPVASTKPIKAGELLGIAHETARHGLQRAPQSVHILLVEDHEPTRTALTSLLRRRHYPVECAGSLAEARVLASQYEFQLLISDIGLPDGEGYELMRELGQHHKLVGIALTGYGMENDIARSESAGFVAHLTKPVRIQALDAALASILPPV